MKSFSSSGRPKAIQLVILILLIYETSLSNVVGEIVGDWKVSFGRHHGKELQVSSKGEKEVNLTIYDVEFNSNTAEDLYFKVEIEDEKFAVVNRTILRRDMALMGNGQSGGGPALWQWHGPAVVQGRWLGFTSLDVAVYASSSAVAASERSQQTLEVTVVRPKSLDDRLFRLTVTLLVLLMFVNLGTALQMKRLKVILLMPIGPLIGFCSRYILMPFLSLGLGYAFFPDSKNLQLALFFSAISPSGGVANVCTIFLKGNINLSVATTMINGLLGIGMLPLWIFILAKVVFRDSPVDVPVVDLSLTTLALIAFIAVGILLRVFIPKTTTFIFRFLKPFSIVLSLCLIGFAVGINAFAFKEMTLMIFLASFLMPICAYLLIYGLAKLCRQTATDSLTIAIETSVLNMATPIILLQHGLGEPRADMTIIVPIMSSLMSLLLVSVFYIVRRLFGWNVKKPESFDTKQYVVME